MSTSTFTRNNSTLSQYLSFLLYYYHKLRLKEHILYKVVPHYLIVATLTLTRGHPSYERTNCVLLYQIDLSRSRGHPSNKTRFTIPREWPYKRGTTVHVKLLQLKVKRIHKSGQFGKFDAMFINNQVMHDTAVVIHVIGAINQNNTYAKIYC